MLCVGVACVTVELIRRWCIGLVSLFVFVKQKTAYEMRMSDWSSDVCSSDLTVSHCQRAIHSIRQATQDPTDPHGAWRAALLSVDFRRQIVDQHVRRCYEIGRASCRERVCQYV